MFLLAINEEGSLLGSEKWKPGLKGLIGDTKPGFKHFGMYWGKKIASLVVHIWRRKINRELDVHDLSTVQPCPSASKESCKLRGLHPDTFTVWLTIGTREGLKWKEIPKSKGDLVRRISQCSVAGRNPSSGCPPHIRIGSISAMWNIRLTEPLRALDLEY